MAGIAGFFKNIKANKDQKKLEAELKRKEEFDTLLNKQKANETLVYDLKTGLHDLQKSFKDLEDVIKKSSLMCNELVARTEQITILKAKPNKFIFKILNNWKIKKLTIQCDAQKKKVEESEKIIGKSKEEAMDALKKLQGVFN
ncbi:MAG: hypothetical protein FWC01_09090 [Treponema sp.]|nr:hypothetical protein [Treponema sp.]